ncbi:hypothetical protein [Zavarzinia compransoris]|uniref:Integral membrane protein n=1 Tax=Zavarzinia compransoris TaxID=1264899 RepID=A0A317ECC4_9PROT|nr:hypothetical protein [Zavarzinia compransoris]PWR23906.1 hypothetical protein DKG75_04975 [Zavarzinia compransoris]TDP48150.1 hypothetical protein DES42_102452 [Zavarzinia compransoris]
MSLSALLRSARSLLLIDAATCLAMGAILLAAGDAVAGLTALDPALLFWAGVLLLPIGAYMALAALGPRVAPFHLGVIVAGNFLWVLASVAVLAVGAANGPGIAFVGVQAVAVAVLGGLELRALAGGGGPAAAVAKQ